MLNTVDKVLLLMRAGVTADATTDALSRLAAAAQELEAAHGDILYRNGEEPRALFIVLDGLVRIDMEGAPPRWAERGDWAGAVPLITGGPHQGTATVLVASHLLRVERADFEELLDEDGELARALMAGLLRSLTALIPTAVEAA
jgi:CRP-like cAMP-binding protein